MAAARCLSKQVTVVSYNVLAPTLCSVDRFVTSNPKNLDPEARFKKVLRKLEPHVEQGAIICLQEVSMTWGGLLHTWFHQRRYTFIPTFYSSAFSDYMGVGLAYPTDRFKEIALDVKRVSEVARTRVSRSEPKSEEETWYNWAVKKTGVLQSTLQSLLGRTPPRPPQSHWEAARYRYNRMVTVTLEPADGGARFTVATYHMPCAFFNPPVMSLHAAWCAEHAFAVAGTTPLILCGDFNLKPRDPGYELLTTGSLSNEADWPAYPEVPGATWRAGQNSSPLVSAYAYLQGSEPQYTNWAHEPGKDEFIDCLDYVFATADLKPTTVIDLPMRDMSDGPYPSASEPSDHLLIGATFTLPSSL